MYYFRMFDPDFRPYPVYDAIKNYTPRARYMPIGFHGAGHWAIESGEGWEQVNDERAYLGEYKRGATGAALHFAFRGTDLDLVVLQNPYGGAVRVQIDSDPPREIALWRTDPGAGGRISLASGLDDREHRVTITVTRAPLAINGFVVRRDNAWWVWRVGALGAVGLLGGWVVRWRGLRRRR